MADRVPIKQRIPLVVLCLMLLVPGKWVETVAGRPCPWWAHLQTAMSFFLGAIVLWLAVQEKRSEGPPVYRFGSRAADWAVLLVAMLPITILLVSVLCFFTHAP